MATYDASKIKLAGSNDILNIKVGTSGIEDGAVTDAKLDPKGASANVTLISRALKSAAYPFRFFADPSIIKMSVGSISNGVADGTYVQAYGLTIPNGTTLAAKEGYQIAGYDVVTHTRIFNFVSSYTAPTDHYQDEVIIVKRTDGEAIDMSTEGSYLSSYVNVTYPARYDRIPSGMVMFTDETYSDIYNSISGKMAAGSPWRSFVKIDDAGMAYGSPIDPAVTNTRIYTDQPTPLYKGMKFTAKSGYQFAAYDSLGIPITTRGSWFSTWTFENECLAGTVMVKKTGGETFDIETDGDALSDYLIINYVGVDLFWTPDDYSQHEMIYGAYNTSATNRVKARYLYLYKNMRISANDGYLFNYYDYTTQVPSSWLTSGIVPDDLAMGVIVFKKEDDSEFDLEEDGSTLDAYATIDYSEVTRATDNSMALNDVSLEYLVDNIERGIGSKWSGKNAAFIGDSITYGTGTQGGYIYYQLLDDKIGFGDVYAQGVGGSCYSVTSNYGTQHSPIASRWQTIPTDRDLVVIFAGTNDWGHNTPLGTIDDTTDVSFFGALYVTISGILAANPDVRLVLMTPLHRWGFGTYEEDTGANGQGLQLKSYVDAIKAEAEMFGVPVIDLFSTACLNPRIAEIKTAYVPDGLHPNANGHMILADRIAPLLETM